MCPALQLGASVATPARNATVSVPVPSLDDLFARGPTAIIVDLVPVMGVILAATASQSGLAHVVLVLPRWPHADAVLPCGELMGALVASSRWLTEPVDPPHVMFVLDGERRESTPRPHGDPRADNRYNVAAGDLPNLKALRAAGIQHIVKLTRAA